MLEPLNASTLGTASVGQVTGARLVLPGDHYATRMSGNRSDAPSPRSTVSGLVTGNLDGYGTAPALVGVGVAAYNTTCNASPPSPSSCPELTATSTGRAGEYSMNLTDGTSYYIAASPDPSITGKGYPAGFGGAVQEISLNGNMTVNLSVYPNVAYGNTTIVLPDYVCDSEYVDNSGGDGPGCQNPVLSWTQSGAYYLTSANTLAFYSFVNRTLTNLTRWAPLYQGFPNYAMIPNQLFITQDGSYIYSWGTLTNSSTILTAEAFNVTTHRLFEYNFTAVGTNNVRSNGQVQLTGWDGNDSQVTLILTNGSVVDHPLWSKSQRYVGTLDFFEANNVYWEPYLNGYIDVEAEGSSNDGIEEWQLSGPSDLNLTQTFRSTWGSSIQVEGVNGVAFNVTSRELSVQAEWSGLTYAVNSIGTLTTLLQVTNRYPRGPPPAFPIGPVSASDRSELVASGPMMGGNYQGFANDSWLISVAPGHTGFYSTNVSPYLPNGKLDGVPVFSWLQWSQEGQFYNASYLIAPDSYACAQDLHGACTVDGGEGAANGTIWWMWKLGLPEFPEGAMAPAADPTAPPPTQIVSANVTESTIELDWSPPTTSALINYTVAWGTTPTYTNYTSLGPSNDSFTIAGLEPSTRYDFSVEAWNLHFHGTSAGVSSAVTDSRAFTITFREKGLPSKTSWNVTVGNVARSSMGPTIQFSENDGNYSDTVWTPVSGASSGSFTVEGSNLVILVLFYHVTFKESGLPTDTRWNLTTNGVTLNSTSRTISLYLENGTYRYVGTPDRSNYLGASGTFTVRGAGEAVSLRFTKHSSNPAIHPAESENLAIAKRDDTGAVRRGFGGPPSARS